MKVFLFNQSSCSHPSLEVVVYLFLSLKWWQSSILWSLLCRFHSLYHCSRSLSLITIFCHYLSLVVTLCHYLSLVVPLVVTLCHSLSFVVTRCHSLSLFVIRCHSLSLVVPLVVTRCHLLSLVVSLVVTHCHSLSLNVTRCTTRLSFYKRSQIRLHIKNSNTQIAYYNTFHPLRYSLLRYTKCLFTSIQKQQNTLKSSLLFKKNANFTGK